ncbi:MAG: phage virion morphogenesis protein [Burkholderiales bacterium]
MIAQGIIVGGEQQTARFSSMPGKLRAELRVGVGRAALRVQRQSKEFKLSGQVLKVRTGRLRRSINVKMSETESSVTGSVGTNVSYARPHEYGFHGTVTVREHLRRSVSGFHTVRSHPRKVDMPERSFLRSALADMSAAIRLEFEQATQRAMR